MPEQNQSAPRADARPAFAAAFAAIALGFALASCSSLPRHRDEMPSEWIEGKDYPVTVTFSEGKKLDAIAELRLEYRSPSGDTRYLRMERTGASFSAVIPAQDMAPGKLAVTVSALSGKKFAKVRKRTVVVLNFAQARAKREAALAGRISFSYEAEVPFYRDGRISLSVSLAGPKGKLTFAQRKRGASSYVFDFPAAEDGSFAISVPVSEILEGYEEFYLEYEEEDPDLGRIKAFAAPGRNEANPFRMRVIGREEMIAKVSAELRAALSFRHASLASVYYDHDLSAAFDPSKGTYLKEILEGEPEIALHCAAGTEAFSDFPLVVRDRRVAGRIGAGELAAGIDRYYFSLAAQTTELGRIETALPEAGARKPFVLEVLDERESERKVVSELQSALLVKAPSSIRETEEFRVEAAFHEAPEGLFFSRSSFEDIRLELRSSSSQAFSAREGRVPMARAGSSYRASISSDRLASGIDRFAIAVSAETNTPMGRVGFSYPSSGDPWVSFDVVTLEELRAAKRKALGSRLGSEVRLLSKETGPSETRFLLKDVPSGCHVFLYLKRPGDKSFTMREMSPDGDAFSYLMPEKELKSGYRYYYYVVAFDDPDLGLIEALYPEDGPRAPFDFSAKSPLKKGG